MSRRPFSKISLLCFLTLFLSLVKSAAALQWIATGPEGGEVRSLAADPSNPANVFLGTSSGTIFCSADSGRRWHRCAHLGKADDYVVDNIAVDPSDSQKIYAAAWNLSNRRSGDLFRSIDGGKNWKLVPGMHGKSIRCMAIAAESLHLLFVGALDGVFRSANDGRSWHKISASRPVIRNVESIAVDRDNADIVYVGTWHLAWKTNDGGAHWRRIDNGMIDDSDVFSIILDQSNSRVVFAGACSGIYKSNDGGLHFERIQNMPFSARRTHVLKQGPQNASAIYAGTTEGMWVTTDSGGSWKRVTSPELVVNDILVDSRAGRILLATDRAGILASEGDQLEFHPSNSGFAHRYVSSILVADNDPNTIYIGVVNDREYGGVFVSTDGGHHWVQTSAGLNDRDVFTLQRGTNGAILAGTDHGIYILRRNTTMWSPSSSNERSAADGRRSAQDSPLSTSKVYEIRVQDAKWLAATSTGLYMGHDAEHWSRISTPRKHETFMVSQQGNTVVVLDSKGFLISTNGGDAWRRAKVPSRVESITGVVITDQHKLVLGSCEGLLRSADLGRTWRKSQRGLPPGGITSLAYDRDKERLYALSKSTMTVFESDNSGISWHPSLDTGWSLRSLSIEKGKILAATKFDGILVPTRDDNTGFRSTTNGLQRQ